MLKELKYLEGKSEVISFSLPSSSRRFTLHKGDSTGVLQIEQSDIRTLHALNLMGVKSFDVSIKGVSEVVAPKVEEPVVEEPVVVESPVEESVEEQETPLVEEPKHSMKELLRLNHANLCALAEEIGVVYDEKQSKREIAELILAKEA